MKLSINLQKTAVPNRLDNYLCYRVILCIYVETQNLDVSMETEIVLVLTMVLTPQEESRPLLTTAL